MTLLELAGITALEGLLLAAAGCGSVSTSTPSPDAAADVGGSAADAGADVFVVRGEGGADRGGEASPDVGQVPQVASCDNAPTIGVDVEQCATDCHVAICSAGGVRFVGCTRTIGADGRPAQFYCPLHGPDFVVPRCVASCP